MKEDNYKLKLYEGAAVSPEKAVKILSLKEAATRELQELKLKRVRVSHHETLTLIKIRSKGTRETLRGDLSKQLAGAGYCNRRHPWKDELSSCGPPCTIQQVQ